MSGNNGPMISKSLYQIEKLMEANKESIKNPLPKVNKPKAKKEISNTKDEMAGETWNQC